jgi:hypothetical protein
MSDGIRRGAPAFAVLGSGLREVRLIIAHAVDARTGPWASIEDRIGVLPVAVSSRPQRKGGPSWRVLTFSSPKL